MNKYGVTQDDVATLLVEEFGAPSKPSQETVSRWVSGHTKRPSREYLDPIRAYCESNAPELQRSRDAVSADRASEPKGGSEDEAAFADLVRTITDEPLLGDRQANLIDALTERLANGPSLTAEDLDLARGVARTLNVELDSQSSSRSRH
jgi:transcriptional regulator with XRE-family HTH domain